MSNNNIINFNEKSNSEERRFNKVLKLKEDFDKNKQAYYTDKKFITLVRKKEDGFTVTLFSRNDDVKSVMELIVEKVKTKNFDSTNEAAVELVNRHIEMAEKYYEGTFFDHYTIEFVKKFEKNDNSFDEYYKNLIKSKGKIK